MGRGLSTVQKQGVSGVIRRPLQSTRPRQPAPVSCLKLTLTTPVSALPALRSSSRPSAPSTRSLALRASTTGLSAPPPSMKNCGLALLPPFSAVPNKLRAPVVGGEDDARAFSGDEARSKRLLPRGDVRRVMGFSRMLVAGRDLSRNSDAKRECVIKS